MATASLRTGTGDGSELSISYRLISLKRVFISQLIDHAILTFQHRFVGVFAIRLYFDSQDSQTLLSILLRINLPNFANVKGLFIAIGLVYGVWIAGSHLHAHPLSCSRHYLQQQRFHSLERPISRCLTHRPRIDVVYARNDAFKFRLVFNRVQVAFLSLSTHWLSAA